MIADVQDKMRYESLGNTGLLVSRLCLGTMTFGDGGMFKAIGAVGQKEADTLIQAAIEGGINFFDTADIYSAGFSEKTLGQSLRNLNISRKDVVLATERSMAVWVQAADDVGASRKHRMDGIEASLRRLQTDYVDF